MSLSKERIRYLLRVYTAGVATDAEEAELFEWVVSTQDDAIVRERIEQLIQANIDEKFPEVDWDHIYQNVFLEARKRRLRLFTGRSGWYRVAATVLLLLMAGGGVYFAIYKKKPQERVAAEPGGYARNDVRPGNAKAILQAGDEQVRLRKADTSFVLGGNTVKAEGGSLAVADVKPAYYTLITPRGGEYRLTLSDGTEVWLNAGSRLEYPAVFKGDTRKVMLEGEAYFEVQRDADHPFVVQTAGQQIRVLGTAFNVQAYPDEAAAVTTLVEGKVQLNASGKTLLLELGQQAQLTKEGRLGLNPDADVEQAIAWKNGYFRFRKADIHTIMQQLARWYDVEVIYSDDLEPRSFGAIISRDNNISRVLGLLEATGEIRFKIEGKNVFVY